MRRGLVVAVFVLVVATALTTPVSPAAPATSSDEPSRPLAIGGPIGVEGPIGIEWPIDVGASMDAANATDLAVRSPAVAQAGNATAYLAPPAGTIETTGYRRAPLDVAGALAIDTAEIEGRLADAVADERFAAASSATRREWLRASAARVEERVTALSARHAAAIRGFNNATIPERRFLRELAVIDAAADDLASAVDRIEERARSVSGITIGGDLVTAWARDRRLAIGTLRGPVRDRLAVTITTAVEPPPIYVETTGTGIVLASVEGNRYYREAVFPDLRAPPNASQAPSDAPTRGTLIPGTPSESAGIDSVTGNDSTTTTSAPEPAITSIADAIDRVTELYPRAGSETIGTDSIEGAGTDVSRVTLFYDRGRLTVYLDRTTGTAFAEQQYQRLTAVQPVDSATNATDALALTVNRTHPTGPLSVSVADPATGEAVNATITVDTTSIGETGVDGRLWTLQPRGAFTVTARRGNETARVAVNATAARPASR